MLNPKKYRVAKDIVIPKGHSVQFINRMKQELLETVGIMVKVGPDMHFDWYMYRDDALAAGLIEEVPSADPI
jgi:hypothetical protein